MSSIQRTIEAQLPFSNDMKNGEVRIKIENTENGPDLWIYQSGDSLLIAACDWPKIRKGIDDIVGAYNDLELRLNQ